MYKGIFDCIEDILKIGDICDVEFEDCNDCGWYGIDEVICVVRGCCYDDIKLKVKWCFYLIGKESG